MLLGLASHVSELLKLAQENWASKFYAFKKKEVFRSEYLFIELLKFLFVFDSVFLKENNHFSLFLQYRKFQTSTTWGGRTLKVGSRKIWATNRRKGQTCRTRSAGQCHRKSQPFAYWYAAFGWKSHLPDKKESKVNMHMVH